MKTVKFKENIKIKMVWYGCSIFNKCSARSVLIPSVNNKIDGPV